MIPQRQSLQLHYRTHRARPCVLRGIDNSRYVSVDYSSRTHRARLKRNVQRHSRHPPRAAQAADIAFSSAWERAFFSSSLPFAPHEIILLPRTANAPTGTSPTSAHPRAISIASDMKYSSASVGVRVQTSPLLSGTRIISDITSRAVTWFSPFRVRECLSSFSPSSG